MKRVVGPTTMIAVVLQGAFAFSATMFAFFLSKGDAGWTTDSLGGSVFAWVVALGAWWGAYALARGQWGRATIGAWCSVLGNVWLFSGLILPIAFAVAISSTSAIRAMRRTERAR